MLLRFRRTFVVLLTALAAMPVAAQSTSCASGNSCTLSLNAELVKVYVARLSLNTGTSTLTPPTAANFGTAAGVITANAVQLTVRSNASHTVTVAAASQNFTGNGGIKPASSLTYSTDGSTYKTVAGSGSALVSSAAATSSTTYTIGYKTTYDWLTDRPGTYTLNINYTLSSP